MRITIRQIGNSKGVIIPASFLAETGLQDEVEMSLLNHSIIITPIKKNPRQGWFNGYHATDDEDGWDGFVTLPSEEDEWEW